MWQFLAGGKDLHGPQASGLIVGRTDLIEACRANGAPHQRFARAMKVGKEEMVGLLAAVEWYLQQDHAARAAHYEAVVQSWVSTFVDWPGITARRDFPNEAGQPVPRTLIEFDPILCGLTAVEVRQRLWEGDPPVAVAPAGITGIYLTPDTLESGEEHIIAGRLKQILQLAPQHA